MRSLFLFLVMALFSVAGNAQVSENLSATPDPNKKIYIVDASCGECNFDLPGYGCDVAVRMEDGKSYYVDGVGIYDYGHPHAKGGFCVAVHKAEVQGELVNGRFKATYFKLLKDDADHKSTKEEKK